ncbi:MAG: DNA recombination protein RmuC [Sphingomicrobium sp.]
MSLTVVAFVVLALVVGAMIGWLYASREAAGAKHTVESLRLQLDEVVRERDVNREAATKLAALQATQQERDRNYEERLQELKALEAKVEGRFGELAGKAVEQAHDAFLKRADEKLGTSGKENAAKLETLLQPVKDTLQRYEADLRELEKDRKGAYEGLNAQISIMREGQERVASEALRLRTALRSSTGDVGRWGEEQCRNVLEQAGLQEGIDFEEQVSTDASGDRSKPDFVVNVPGNRRIVIDVKCSVDAFIGATETNDEILKERLLSDHARAIRNHAQSLMKRSYQDKFKNSATFVAMFIPGENFLHAAIQRDAKLLSDGQKGNIIIVGPTNLLSIILNVAALRDQARLAERAEHIGALGRRLYENLSTLGKNAHAMSGAVRSVVTNWNKLVGTLDGHWLNTARKFDEFGVGKGSPDVRELEFLDVDIRDAQKLQQLDTGQDEDPPQIAAE